MNPVTIRQIRAAREMLGWSQRKLAAHAELSYVTICRGEKNGRITQRTIDKLAATLEGHGIEFLNTSRRAGIVLVEPEPSGG